MNKADLTEEVSQHLGLTKAKSAEAIDFIFATITKSLRKGENVTLVGFGTFDVKKRESRKGRNPQTGEAIKIKARTVPKFRPGKALRDTVAKVKL